MSSKSSKIQLQGITFPAGVRELGASVEVIRFEGSKGRELENWAQNNLFQGGDEKWGIVASSKTKEESEFLAMGFRRLRVSRLKLVSGRVERVEEEITEPELCEFHMKSKDPVLELYSFSAKQRSTLFSSLREKFGRDEVKELVLTKDGMKSLMTEAIEITSVSLSSLGNPFFSDATLTGTDPTNSKTYRELVTSGEIRSFRGKFQSRADDASSSPVTVTISSKCKLRFFASQSTVLQSDVEEFVEKVTNIAQLREVESDLERKIVAS